MMKKMGCAALLFLIASSTVAGGSKDAAKCEEVKRQIRVIEAKMRNGYSAAQGIRYEQRLRDLKEKRYQLCR